MSNDTTVTDPRTPVLSAYVTSRFFPPLDPAIVGPALVAVDACAADESDTDVTIPDTVRTIPRAAHYVSADSAYIVRAADLVDALRLWDAVDDTRQGLGIGADELDPVDAASRLF